MSTSQQTPSTMGDRLIQLAKTLQFGWFVGHVTLLVCVVRYTLSYITFNYNSKMAGFSYRTAFVAAAATYGVVVFKAVRAKLRTSSQQQSPLALIADENVQYLLLALVWLFSRQIPLAMGPFAVYSLFHVLTYTRANLLPVIQGPQPASAKTPASQTGLAGQIGNFVKQYYDTSMSIVALLEISLWFRVFFTFLTFTKGSWILLAIYTAFLRSRYSQSQYVQGTIANMTTQIDQLVAHQAPGMNQTWATVKGVIRQVADITDVGKYVKTQPVAKKAN